MEKDKQKCFELIDYSGLFLTIHKESYKKVDVCLVNRVTVGPVLLSEREFRIVDGIRWPD